MSNKYKNSKSMDKNKIYSFFLNALVHMHFTVVHIVSLAVKLSHCSFIMIICVSCLVIWQYSGWGHDLGGVCVLASRGAATLVEGVIGDLGSAGHRVAMDSAVQLDYRGLGGHWGVAILCWPVITVKQSQETPVELKKRWKERSCVHKLKLKLRVLGIIRGGLTLV